MTTDTSDSIIRYCGRIFNREEIELIRNLISSNPQYDRSKLSHVVCDGLGWMRAGGKKKDMSCRVAMLRMHRDGLITLPPPQSKNGNGKNRVSFTSASDPGFPVTAPAGELGQLCFYQVKTRRDSFTWNELVARYHYLGYTPIPGAQIRYLVFTGCRTLLAAIGFGASAWKVAPRDKFIGWTSEERRNNLHLIVNNARFLILPWVTSHNLASRILAGVSKQMSYNWQERYGYTPVLLETFVERQRFQGTCYRAANWICVGQTKGRGKLDREHQCSFPVKDVFLYPLQKDFRQIFCSPPSQ